ncbi:MAG: hypothetical protein EHM35_18520 [Planctomycetaceae bacterium]|nr:MAG: hypothetical protein EHM35_18520 [Planctomycetaceae bacterium]
MKLGTQVIRSGWLRLVRDEFALSMVSLAQLLGTYAATVKTWEDGTATLVWKESARRAATFYLGYLDTLAKLQRAGISPEDLMSLRTASMYLGKAGPSVREDCVAGDLTCLDLGVLGTFVWKKDVGR